MSSNFTFEAGIGDRMVRRTLSDASKYANSEDRKLQSEILDSLRLCLNDACESIKAQATPALKEAISWYEERLGK